MGTRAKTANQLVGVVITGTILVFVSPFLPELTWRVASAIMGAVVLISVARIDRSRFERSIKEVTIRFKSALLRDYLRIDHAKDITSELTTTAIRWIEEGERSKIDDTLRNYLKNNPQVFGVWVAWEPNTFSSTDVHSSRYAFRDHGTISMIEIPNVEKEEFYTRPFRSGQPMLIDPFTYKIDDLSYHMTSATAPITVKDRKVGVCGTDLLLKSTARLSPALLAIPTWTGRRSTETNSTNDPAGQLPEAPILPECDVLIEAIVTAAHHNDEIGSSFETLRDAGSRLSEKMKTVSEAVAHMAADIVKVNEQVFEQNTGVQEASSSVEEMSRTITSLKDRIQEQSSMVTEASSAVEQLIASIQSLREVLQSNTDRFEELNTASDHSSNRMQSVNATIREIAAESGRLLEANTVIQRIAAQTSLLAMNAAIEAAHAGEYGRGFAVVADEIRALSENAGRQSGTVSTALKSIKQRIEQCAVESDLSLESVASVAYLVGEVHNRELEINQAMTEQAAGTDQIIKALTLMVNATQEVQTGAEEMEGGASAMLEAVQALVSSSQEISSLVNDASAELNSIKTSVSSLEGLADVITRNVFIAAEST